MMHLHQTHSRMDLGDMQEVNLMGLHYRMEKNTGDIRAYDFHLNINFELKVWYITTLLLVCINMSLLIQYLYDLFSVSRLDFNTFYTEQLEKLCADRSLAENRKEETSG